MTTVLSNGVRATIGELVSRAAYIRRSDPSLYRNWIKNVERRPAVRFDAKMSVIVFLAEVDTKLLEIFLTGLQKISSLQKLYLITNEINRVQFATMDLPEDLDAEVCNVAALGTLLNSNEVKKCHHFVVIDTLCQFAEECFGVLERQMRTGADIVFSDHDYIANDQRYDPYFKPGYSPELLFDPAYAPVIVVRSELMYKVLRQTENILTGQELIMACFKNAMKPAHVGHVLMHLLHPVLAPRAFRDYANMTHLINKTTDSSHYPELYEPVSGNVVVSIIIPTRNMVGLLRDCVDSILRHLYHFDVEILILDNRSDDPETLAWLEHSVEKGDVKVIRCDYPFNWSRLSNDGINQAEGELIILLNNDTLVITPVSKGIGTVGPLLMYPDKTIQHAGVVAGFGGFADHIYMGEATANRPAEIFVSPMIRRDVLANTGACLAFSKKTHGLVEGFDESFTVAGDVDFCLRVFEKDLRNIFDPGTSLIHYESRTRHKGLPEEDKTYLRSVLDRVCPKGDPFFNENITLSSRSPMPRLWADQ